MTSVYIQMMICYQGRMYIHVSGVNFGVYRIVFILYCYNIMLVNCSLQSITYILFSCRQLDYCFDEE